MKPCPSYTTATRLALSLPASTNAAIARRERELGGLCNVGQVIERTAGRLPLFRRVISLLTSSIRSQTTEDISPVVQKTICRGP